MTDLELDKALALAIGYRPEHIATNRNSLFCYRHGWNKFSHKDWNVISPIAEAYDCFPVKTYHRKQTNWGSLFATQWVYADTPQRAIALAVIKGVGK